MEKLSDSGYVPMDHRELRFTFKHPRDLLDPDLAVASAQIPRGDRQVLNEAKKYENENKRVWFFLTFPATAPDGKVIKLCKVDLLIATPHGAMVLKVLDWPERCSTLPGEKWVEFKSDGSSKEHSNQLAELDEATQWVRAFLEAKGACPSTISSYILFTSPHVKPNFTSDPRVVVGPAACALLVSGNGKENELAESKTLSEIGKALAVSVLNKIRRSDEAPKPQLVQSSEAEARWKKLQQCLDATPQFDLLFLRKNGCYIFGKLERFEEALNEKPGFAESLSRFSSRDPSKKIRFEHSASGILGSPIAFVTGGLGWQPMCRVRYDIVGCEVSSVKTPMGVISSLDVPPTTRLLFRAYGCEGLISAEVNDVDSLELHRVFRPLNTTEDGTTTDVMDHIGQMIGGVLTKSIQAGVKSMLPFPFNSL